MIVCDDGSSDGTAAALAPFGDRVTVLTQHNRGEAGAKNTATRAASGDFVAILDADDVYLPERLEALGELAAARPDLDILTTDATLVAGGRPVRSVYDETWTFEVADQRRAILERNFIFGHVAVRREALLAAGGFDEAIRWTTDWDCWLRLIFAGSRAGLVDEPLARTGSTPERCRASGRGCSGNGDDVGEGARPRRRPGARRPRAKGAGASLGGAAARPLEVARDALRAATPPRAGAHSRSQGPRAGERAKSVAVAVAPGLARRLNARRERGGFTGASGIGCGGEPR